MGWDAQKGLAIRQTIRLGKTEQNNESQRSWLRESLHISRLKERMLFVQRI